MEDDMVGELLAEAGKKKTGRKNSDKKETRYR
jgi:hypothetical protein